MDTFFIILKRTLMALTLSVFALTVVYVPQPWHKTPVAEAGGGGGYATEPTQLINKAELVASKISNKITAVKTTFSAAADAWQWVKENSLDGIAWTLTKAVVSKITSSIVTWINSGFQGNPAFITDLPGFLLEVADGVAGEYIESLGGIGSFICSPFRLDVQISLAIYYDTVRKETQTTPTCTLTGIIDNIEGFLDGLTDLSQGGWNDWFDITARPDMYTPYGQALSAQAGLRASLINAKGEELIKADWGEGFLSGEICDLVETEGTPREDCFISKPGQIIEEALTFTTSTGQRSLIAADEFNEIISALLGQLVTQVVTGAAGLLGLSGGTGYSYSGYDGSFVDQMASEALGNLDTTSILGDMREADTNERSAWNFITGAVPAAANSPINRLKALVDNSFSMAEADVRRREQAELLLNKMIAIRDRNATPPSTALTNDGNILTLNRLRPVLELANNPTATLDQLKTSAIGAQVLTAQQVNSATDAAALRAQIITAVVEDFYNRTYINNEDFTQLKAEFASIDAPNTGGGGGGTAAPINPVIPPTASEPVFPTAPTAPSTPTNQVNQASNSGSIPLPPLPPPNFGG